MRIGKTQLLTTAAFILLVLIGCTSTEDKSQPTEELTKVNGGRVEGIITSADEVGKPISNALVQLIYHPFAYDNSSTEAIAMTKTDAQGKYVFENIEPGVYYPQTTIALAQGGECSMADMSKFIKVEVGSVVNMDLSYSCP